MSDLDKTAAKLICEKIVCLWLPDARIKDGRSVASISRDHGISRGFVKQVITGEALDFPLSFLLNVAKKYGTSIETLIGHTDSGGGILHPDAWVIACVADNAIRRITARITDQSMPFLATAQKGGWSQIDMPTGKKKRK